MLANMAKANWCCNCCLGKQWIDVCGPRGGCDSRSLTQIDSATKARRRPVKCATTAPSSIIRRTKPSPRNASQRSRVCGRPYTRSLGGERPSGRQNRGRHLAPIHLWELRFLVQDRPWLHHHCRSMSSLQVHTSCKHFAIGRMVPLQHLQACILALSSSRSSSRCHLSRRSRMIKHTHGGIGAIHPFPSSTHVRMGSIRHLVTSSQYHMGHSTIMASST